MAITIVATAGAANANSYLSLSDTQDLIDGLMEDDDVVAWGTATTDQKIELYIQQLKGLTVKDF